MSIVEERTRFASGELELEGLLAYPEAAEPRAGVVICAPHPHFAGDLDNNVIRRLARDLTARGFATLRFNYRGVGDSGIRLDRGESVWAYWQRVEEEKAYGPILDDGRAAAGALAHSLRPAADLALVGYSFGAIIAAHLLASESWARAAVMIAPPLKRYPFDFLAGCQRPKCLLYSSHDFLYGPAEIDRLRARLTPPLVSDVVEAEDHFFRGRESALGRRAGRFLLEALRD